VPIVDFFGTLQDPRVPNRLRPQWTAEGVHPSVEGYKRLGHIVAAGVTGAGT
jgi:lysophospholipase L1-like esterase